MDRNLGALAATTAKPSAALAYKYFGVLYQHGRPTPFSGQGAGETTNRYTIIYKGDATAINSNNTDPIGGYTKSSTAVASVTDAIKTPNTYYYNSSSGAWFSVDVSLWSDYGTNKSIYDPCPYGYRVPKSGDGALSSWYGFPSTTWTVNTIESGSIWSSAWWPIAGHRTYNAGALYGVGNEAYYWSSTRHSNAYNSYYLRFDYVGYVLPSNNTCRSVGYSVRCVQERGNASRGTWDVGALVSCSLLGSLDKLGMTQRGGE